MTYLSDASGRAYAGLHSAEGTTTPFLIATSDRGDVVALTDRAGKTFAAYAYDPWGVPTASTVATTPLIADAMLARAIATRQPLRYAGYVYDPETSMYYCSARTYDPLTRQFLSKDPAKDDGEESAYQYCGGDPVGKVDPSGMRQIGLWAARIWYGAPTYNAPGMGPLIGHLVWHGGTQIVDIVTVWFFEPTSRRLNVQWLVSWKPVRDIRWPLFVDYGPVNVKLKTKFYGGDLRSSVRFRRNEVRGSLIGHIGPHKHLWLERLSITVVPGDGKEWMRTLRGVTLDARNPHRRPHGRTPMR